MPDRTLVSQREELRGILLAQRQPKSGRALRELIGKVRARVVDAVLKDPQVTERLAGTRYRVVGTDMTEDKPSGDTKMARRLGEVGVYDYVRNVLVVPVIALRTGQVVTIEERRGVQPSLTPEEVAEAKNIAFSDPAFRSLARYRQLDIVAFPARAAFAESHPAFGHRCFALYFWTRSKPPKRLAAAMVDLSAQQVVPGDPDDPAIIQEPQTERLPT